MVVNQMKLTAKIAKIAEVKGQLDALKAEFDDLKDSITAELKESGLNNYESNGIKVSVTSATYYSYEPSAIEYLKGLNLNNCIKEEVVTDAVKACLKAGVINETELNKHRKASVRDSFKVTVK